MPQIKISTGFIALSICLLLSVTESFSKEQATLVFAARMTEIATEKKGGYPELASLLKQQRKSNVPTFFLFGGGSLGPSALSSLDRGTHIIDLLNSLEPDAMGVAKREFSFLEDELSLRSYEASFPLVSSNLVDSLTHGDLDGLVASTVVQQGSYKFGIISVIDNSVIEDYAVARVKVTDQKKAIEKQSQLLRKQGVDLIILLYSKINPEISKLIDSNSIDISLRKDEHLDQSKNKEFENDVLLEKSGQIAIVKLSWDKGKPESLELKWEAKTLARYPKDHQVLRQVINYTDRLSILLQQKIGMLTTAMDTLQSTVRAKESPFANYIVDALKSYTDAEIALLNGGTIRGEKNYRANTLLTRRDISKELPFRNKVILLKVTGKQLVEALENGFSLIERVEGRFPQVSGMQVLYDSSKAVNNRVVSVKINGMDLDNNKVYKLATTDFLAIGGDGYSVFRNSEQVKYDNQMSRLVSDIVIDSIKSIHSIAVRLDGRLIDLNKIKSANLND